MNTLPIFRLQAPDTDVERISTEAFGITGAKALDKADRPTVRDGKRRVEVFPNGGLWMQDEALWKLDTTPKPDLFFDKQAESTARHLLAGLNLASDSSRTDAAQLVRVDGKAGSVAVVHSIKDKTRSVYPLDVHVGYSYSIALAPGPSGLPPSELLVPGVGGGAKVSIKLGEGGKIVGVSAALRQIQEVATMAPLIGKADADRAFLLRRQRAGLEIVRWSSHLAYYWAPAGVAQQYLVPVYAYSATARIGGREVPLRMTFQLAAEQSFDLAPWQPRPHVAGLPHGITRGVLPPDPGTLPGVLPAAPPAQLARLLAESYWIMDLGGLMLSKANAAGLRDGLPGNWSSSDYGDPMDLTRGDPTALATNWTINDDRAWTSRNKAWNGVDTCDLAFYVGHADADGWMLVGKSPPGSPVLTPLADSDLVSPGMWGSADSPATQAQGGRLKWLVVAACGPLQDASMSGAPSPNDGLDAVARWKPAFNGLRLLMGYGDLTTESADEGARLMTYANQGGTTLASAWLRAGAEVQHPTSASTYVAVLAAQGPGDDALGDYLPGSPGPVGVAPTVAPSPSPLRDTSTLVLISTPC